MPGSVCTIDTTSEKQDPQRLLPSSSEQLRVESTKKRASLIELPPSPADSDLAMRHASPKGSSSTTMREEEQITRTLDRGAPGDQAIFSDAKSPEQKELARKKSQYYNEVFAARESSTSARERVLKDSPILADVRTNVIVSVVYQKAPSVAPLLTISRSQTSTPLLPTCPTSFLPATNVPKNQLLSQSHTRAACYFQATSILHTPLPFPPFPRNYKLSQTSGMRLCWRGLWRTVWELLQIEG